MEKEDRDLIINLLKKAKDDQPNVRKQAINEIAGLEISHPKLVEALLNIRDQDLDLNVRQAAATAVLMPVHKVHLSPEAISENSINPQGTNDPPGDPLIHILHEQSRQLLQIDKHLIELNETLKLSRAKSGVYVLDVDLSFEQMVKLLLKAAFASIPAGIILAFFAFLLSMCTSML
jgi:hypothetical protein